MESADQLKRPEIRLFERSDGAWIAVSELARLGATGTTQGEAYEHLDQVIDLVHDLASRKGMVRAQN